MALSVSSAIWQRACGAARCQSHAQACALFLLACVPVTENTTRLTVEAAYGARKVSTKFWPYLDFVLSPETRELATPRQLRLLGEHPLSNYG
eukprot:SAG22_NODE_4561_length_1232_cov_1.987643_1_plen_92_part_00